MYFAEIGTVPSQKSIIKIQINHFGIKLKEINKTVGGWNNLLILIEENHPDLWKKANHKLKLKPQLNLRLKLNPLLKWQVK